MKKFITKEYKGQRVNPDTGEIYEFSECKSVVKTDAEPFFLTYSKQILALYDSTVLNVTTKVLYKLLEFAEFNTRAINELIEIGIISKNKSTYTISENMFWKGDRKAREDIMNAKLMVSFSPVFDEEVEES